MKLLEHIRMYKMQFTTKEMSGIRKELEQVKEAVGLKDYPHLAELQDLMDLDQ